jgi:hypothetical protein
VIDLTSEDEEDIFWQSTQPEAEGSQPEVQEKKPEINGFQLAVQLTAESTANTTVFVDMEPAVKQESILRNFISVENFSDKFLSSNFGQISIPKRTLYINTFILYTNILLEGILMPQKVIIIKNKFYLIRFWQ